MKKIRLNSYCSKCTNSLCRIVLQQNKLLQENKFFLTYFVVQTACYAKQEQWRQIYKLHQLEAFKSLHVSDTSTTFIPVTDMYIRNTVSENYITKFITTLYSTARPLKGYTKPCFFKHACAIAVIIFFLLIVLMKLPQKFEPKRLSIALEM